MPMPPKPANAVVPRRVTPLDELFSKCPRCKNQYVTAPQYCKGSRNWENKGRWYERCWDNKMFDDTTCKYLDFLPELGIQREGPLLDIDCESPWCKNAARPKTRNAFCGFLFCAECCRLAQAQISPRSPCPIGTHNTAARTLHGVTKPIFSPFIDPAYEHKLDILTLEQKQRALGSQQARRAEDVLTVLWWREKREEPFRTQVPHPGRSFHPKTVLALVNALRLTAQSVYEGYDPALKQWCIHGFDVVPLTVQGVKQVHFRDFDIPTTPGMPTNGQSRSVTVSPRKRAPSSSFDASPSPTKQQSITPSTSRVIDVDDLPDSDVFGPIAVPATPTQDGRKWPPDYATMATCLSLADELMAPPSNMSGKLAFAAVFPHWGTDAEFKSKKTTFYNYINSWKASSLEDRDAFSSDTTSRWSTFYGKWKKKKVTGSSL